MDGESDLSYGLFIHLDHLDQWVDFPFLTPVWSADPLESHIMLAKQCHEPPIRSHFTAPTKMIIFGMVCIHTYIYIYGIYIYTYHVYIYMYTYTPLLY